MSKVRILYFASLREKIGKEAEEIELPAGIGTVASEIEGMRFFTRMKTSTAVG